MGGSGLKAISTSSVCLLSSIRLSLQQSLWESRRLGVTRRRRLTESEEYASSHIPLPSLALPIRPSQAAYILDQLVSVVRDCLHYGRVCHRDLKGENVMVDPETGDIVVLDLGLATQFTMDEPRLTTCCGSPAFHVCIYSPRSYI